MLLIAYGTRPEFIKLYPLINFLEKNHIKHMTMFTGQHKDLIKEFNNLVKTPTFSLPNTFQKGQSLNSLISKLIANSSEIIKDLNCNVVVQGDAASTIAIAISAFNNRKKVIHIEAGLRTNDNLSPFPEEGYRKMISKIANLHFCPTEKDKLNLKNENIEKNVHVVGNTVVDSCKLFKNVKNISEDLTNLVSLSTPYFLCTLHRRENSDKFKNLWRQLNNISKFINVIYVTHPSVPDSVTNLNSRIKVLPPQSYQNMIYLIDNSKGIISDSGGIQEEAVSLRKKILIVRNNTERPETVVSGYGKIVNSDINSNIDFLLDNSLKPIEPNPFGKNVTNKIFKVLKRENLI